MATKSKKPRTNVRSSVTGEFVSPEGADPRETVKETVSDPIQETVNAITGSTTKEEVFDTFTRWFADEESSLSKQLLASAMLDAFTAGWALGAATQFRKTKP